MTIDNREIPLKFNTKAMMDLEDIIHGDVDKLSEFLGEEGLSTAGTFKRVAQVLRCLANGAIFKHNKDVEMGFIQAEKKPFLDDDYFIAAMDLEDMGTYIQSIQTEIYHGSAVVLPDNVKLAEEDEVLAEIEQIKNQ